MTSASVRRCRSCNRTAASCRSPAREAGLHGRVRSRAGVIASARMARAPTCQRNLARYGGRRPAAMIENGEPARTPNTRSARHQSVEQAGEGRRLSDQLPFIDVSGNRRGRRFDCFARRCRKFQSARKRGRGAGTVCYGAGGTEPTFTDAVLAAGYSSVRASGGRVARRRTRRSQPWRNGIAAARPPVRRSRTASTIAAATMTRAVKAVTTYRGAILATSS